MEDHLREKCTLGKAGQPGDKDKSSEIPVTSQIAFCAHVDTKDLISKSQLLRDITCSFLVLFSEFFFIVRILKKQNLGEMETSNFKLKLYFETKSKILEI